MREELSVDPTLWSDRCLQREYKIVHDLVYVTGSRKTCDLCFLGFLARELTRRGYDIKVRTVVQFDKKTRRLVGGPEKDKIRYGKLPRTKSTTKHPKHTHIGGERA